MQNLIINSAIALGSVGALAAAVLYFISKKFQVEDDPRIIKINEVLPQANCGGCGYPGCKQFAEHIVNASDPSTFYCPVGGEECMKKVAVILGVDLQAKEARVAVLRCNGTLESAPRKIVYSAIQSCLLANHMSTGSKGCPYGCLGLGDCINVCKFDALKMDDETGLPIVDENKCTSCGACQRTCPRNLYELRPKKANKNRVYVACMNKEKGVIAKKNCSSACIACNKCVRIVNDETKVWIKDSLAYIDPSLDVDRYGEELAQSCPTGAIHLKQAGEKL